MSTLYVNGTIHSTSDPYATALLVDGGSVAWVGADDTAGQMRARSGADWEVVDLDGALVAPAFVDSLALDAAATSPDAGSDDGPAAPGGVTGDETGRAAAAAGVFLTARVGDPRPGGHEPSRTASGEASAAPGGTAESVRYVPVEAGTVPASPAEAHTAAGTAADSPADSPVAGLAAVVGPAGLDAAQVSRLAATATEAGVQVYFLPQDPAAWDAVIAAVTAAADTLGPAATGRVRHRVSWNGPVGRDALEAMARLGMSATVVPDGAGRITAPVASLLSAGVPVCLGSGTGTPDLWAAIRACLEHEDPAQRISARAGYTAATRTGLRALPDSLAAPHGMAGRIVPSAPATFALWSAEALSVQAPDGRVAAWSTDARAGTPLLPVLEDGTAAPRCLATVVDGEIRHRSADRS